MYLHTYEDPPQTKSPVPSIFRRSLRLEPWFLPTFQYGTFRLLYPQILNAWNNRTVRRARNRWEGICITNRLIHGRPCMARLSGTGPSKLPCLEHRRARSPGAPSTSAEERVVAPRVNSGPPPCRPLPCVGPAVGGCSMILTATLWYWRQPRWPPPLGSRDSPGRGFAQPRDSLPAHHDVAHLHAGR